MNAAITSIDDLAIVHDALDAKLKVARTKVEDALDGLEDFCTNTDRVADGSCLEEVMKDFENATKEFMQVAGVKHRFMVENHDAMIELNMR